MKISLAQIKSIAGNVQANLEHHLNYVRKAIAQKADLIVFPELSLTGYEPTLAKSLAFQLSDTRLDIFQELSNSAKITIGIGAPTIAKNGICISMIIFQPGLARCVYSKKYLHPDEEPFFVSGDNPPPLKIKEYKISLAICYEISIPNHSEEAVKCGSEIYLASVAKFASGVDKACETLSSIAKKYNITTLMVNAVGSADNGICAGQSSVWNASGELKVQLNDQEETLLIYDIV
ncbi:carbon-nitrogen hydrolase family protein [Marivirga sp. S37H4]|uniref:Carbon-nitrogen hydrolase family protein n=1 Tax=Marivirga aurantiaca TaxID=2802615 RepID=A0A934X0T2_9BACT|nr:carbon-nitrogen hydrolase family protein [Marivirga aurantiaca]MBK6266584.1 carbon-nitrogen hydrolase family protein [Marivirga aurantiaca]